MSMDIPRLNIKFRDSLNYNPQSLVKWPATFGLQGLSKGQFSHRFNRPENWQRVCPFPEPEEYGAPTTRGKDREEFLSWHAGEKGFKGGKFDFLDGVYELLQHGCHSPSEVLSAVSHFVHGHQPRNVPPLSQPPPSPASATSSGGPTFWRSCRSDFCPRQRPATARTQPRLSSGWNGGRTRMIATFSTVTQKEGKSR
jgi:hypothetical protein